MGGFLDGIDGDRLYRQDRLLQTGQTLQMGWILIDGMDFIDGMDIYRRDRHLIDKINYYRQDGRNGHMRQDKPQKKRDTCWQKC